LTVKGNPFVPRPGIEAARPGWGGKGKESSSGWEEKNARSRPTEGKRRGVYSGPQRILKKGHARMRDRGKGSARLCLAGEKSLVEKSG